jgi:hypothetical protein
MSNQTITPYRDEELGDMLRDLDVPEHRPVFHSELRGKLGEERSAFRRRAHLRWGIRLAAAAAVLAAAGAIVGIPGTDHTHGISGPAVATAGTVKAQLRHVLSSMRTLSGVLIADGPQGGTERWHFALDAAGDFGLEGPSAGEVITYDASSGVERSAQHSASMGGSALFYAERSGIAPGAPDQGPPTWILPEQFAAFVRAALAAGDPAVRAIVFDGRPAWRLDVDAVLNSIVPEFSGDHFQITVDRDTGLPVRVVEMKGAVILHEVRLDDLRVDAALPTDAFRLAFPAGAEVARSDDGFQRTSLDQVATTVGYRPLVPAVVPAGFALSEVAVAHLAAATGSEGSNPESRGVVSLTYRSGFDELLVTTRLRGAGQWTDPLATGEGIVDDAQQVTLGRGALAGSSAYVVIAPRGTPHLWVQASDRVITVSGDLSRQELIDVAESLGLPSTRKGK